MSITQNVALQIQELIESGSISPGSKLPSERTLADRFGVSRVSVQAAIRELEQSGYIARQSNHRPVVRQRTGQSHPSHTKRADQIAIWILPDLQDLGGMLILKGIRAGFGKGGYRLLIACPPSSGKEVFDEAEVDFLRGLVGNPQVAGVVIWDTGDLRAIHAYQDLIAAKIPLVFIDRQPPFPVNADVVACNNRLGARTAVQHLLDLGHRRITMVIGSDRASSVIERVEGYRLALAQAELGPSAEKVVVCEVDWEFDIPGAERLLRELMNGPESPTALFAVNDRIALFLVEAAKNLGISVPEELSIVGFDWLLREIPSSKLITTVSQPFEEIGEVAAQRLLDLIHSNRQETPREILINVTLIVGSSTGSPSEQRRWQEAKSAGDHHEKA